MKHNPQFGCLLFAKLNYTAIERTWSIPCTNPSPAIPRASVELGNQDNSLLNVWAVIYTICTSERQFTIVSPSCWLDAANSPLSKNSSLLASYIQRTCLYQNILIHFNLSILYFPFPFPGQPGMQCIAYIGIMLHLWWTHRLISSPLERLVHCKQYLIKMTTSAWLLQFHGLLNSLVVWLRNSKTQCHQPPVISI